MSRRTIWVAVAVAGLVALAGCSGDNKVGNQSLLDKANGSASRLDIVSTSTPTAAPKTATHSAPRHPVAVHTTAPVPQQHATTKPPAATGPQVALTIVINGDSGSRPAFDPPQARIYAGTCAKWVNHDAKARSLSGGITSGLIQPNSSFVFCPKGTGTLSYQDGTRPYATGSLEILPR